MDDQLRVRNQADFQRAFETIVTEAVRNDVEILGGWTTTDSVTAEEYEALITHVSK